MTEQLLTAGQVAKRLAISRTQFYRLLPCLLASGLQTANVLTGGRTRYLASSVDRMISRAADRNTPIIAEPPLVVIGQGSYAKEVYA